MRGISIGCMSLILFVHCSVTVAWAQQRDAAVPVQKPNALVMDDEFKYELVDYGVGRVQGSIDVTDERSFFGPYFWVKFRVTNVSNHLLGTPRYMPSAPYVIVLDNWGNVYHARDPASMIGRAVSTSGPGPPFPARKIGRHKPGESSEEFIGILFEEFVENISEFRVYLSTTRKYRPYFLIRQPTLRQRDLLPERANPPASELGISTGVEVLPPITRKRR